MDAVGRQFCTQTRVSRVWYTDSQLKDVEQSGKGKSMLRTFSTDSTGFPSFHNFNIKITEWPGRREREKSHHVLLNYSITQTWKCAKKSLAHFRHLKVNVHKLPIFIMSAAFFFHFSPIWDEVAFTWIIPLSYLNIS